jgi:hypothetical protein
MYTGASAGTSDAMSSDPSLLLPPQPATTSAAHSATNTTITPRRITRQ